MQSRYCNVINDGEEEVLIDGVRYVKKHEVCNSGYEVADYEHDYYAASLYSFSANHDYTVIDCVRDGTDYHKHFNEGNAYRTMPLAISNMRADRLMRRLRQYQALHDKPVDYASVHFGITSFIEPDSLSLTITTYDTLERRPGEVYFTSRSAAYAAIMTFQDELIWYYTSYMSRLDAKLNKCGVDIDKQADIPVYEVHMEISSSDMNGSRVFTSYAISVESAVLQLGYLYSDLLNNNLTDVPPVDKKFFHVLQEPLFRYFGGSLSLNTSTGQRVRVNYLNKIQYSFTITPIVCNRLPENDGSFYVDKRPVSVIDISEECQIQKLNEMFIMNENRIEFTKLAQNIINKTIN